MSLTPTLFNKQKLLIAGSGTCVQGKANNKELSGVDGECPLCYSREAESIHMAAR